MAPQQRQLTFYHAIVTLLIVLTGTGLLSYGESLKNLWRYPIDGVAFFILIWLAFLSAWLNVRWVYLGKPLSAGLLQCSYYLLAFGLMMDGSATDWPHSNGVVEKLATSALYVALAIFSFIVPVVMLAFSALQILFLRWWFRRHAQRTFPCDNR